MLGPRLRLILLLLGWTAAVTVDHGLRQAIVVQLARDGEEGRALTLSTAFFVAPFLVLAPLNAFLGSRFGARRVLVVAALVRTAALAAFLAASWKAEWALVLIAHVIGAAEAAAFTVVFASLPGAAEESRFPLSRLVAGVAVATLSGLVAGWMLGSQLDPEPFRNVVLVFGVCLFAVLAAAAVRFPPEPLRQDSFRQGVQRFDADVRRLGVRTETFGFLQALMLFWGFSAALATTLLMESETPPAALFWGLVAGMATTVLSGHPTRVLGWIPIALTGLLIVLSVASVSDACGTVLALAGFFCGPVQVSLATGYLSSLPAATRGTGVALAGAAGVAAGLAGFFPAWMVAGGDWPALPLRLAILAGVLLPAASIAWRRRFRDGVELFAALLFSPLYRIRVIGPGVGRFPLEGPVLVVANHAAWFDPLWLGKVVPRRLTPLMVSSFYDLPVIHWLMRRVIRAIRVQESTYRHRVPELQEAVDRLDRGECVVIFPEGILRRREDLLLRRFGQGVWHILSRRPETPVVVCWIEGGWGSYTSYFNGPPGRNKRLGCCRRITIVMDEPRELPAEVLTTHRQTRDYLSSQVLSLRSRLPGIEPATLTHTPVPPGQDDEPVEDENL